MSWRVRFDLRENGAGGNGKSPCFYSRIVSQEMGRGCVLRNQNAVGKGKPLGRFGSVRGNRMFGKGNNVPMEICPHGKRRLDRAEWSLLTRANLRNPDECAKE